VPCGGFVFFIIAPLDTSRLLYAFRVRLCGDPMVMCHRAGVPLRYFVALPAVAILLRYFRFIAFLKIVRLRLDFSCLLSFTFFMFSMFFYKNSLEGLALLFCFLHATGFSICCPSGRCFDPDVFRQIPPEWNVCRTLL